MAFPRKLYLGLSIFVLLFGAIAISEILARAEIALDGKITLSETTCEQSNKTRCTTRYIVEKPDGSSVIYAAGSNDHSLRRRLPVGTLMNKRKWDMSYSIDGKRIDDFPLCFYSGVLVCGTCIGLVGLAASIRANAGT